MLIVSTSKGFLYSFNLGGASNSLVFLALQFLLFHSHNKVLRRVLLIQSIYRFRWNWINIWFNVTSYSKTRFINIFHLSRIHYLHTLDKIIFFTEISLKFQRNIFNFTEISWHWNTPETFSKASYFFLFRQYF